MAAAAKETRRNALKPSSDSPSCEARNSKDLSLLKIRRVWCVIEEGLLSSLVDPLVCVSPPLTDSSGWEFVLVETVYIFCLLGFTWCVLSSLPLDSTDTLRFSLAVSRWRRRATSLCAWACSLACLRACSSALHQLVYCMHIMEGVHVSACMCVNVRSYISVCVWYFEVCSKGE